MKVTHIFLFVLISTFSFGQSIEELDKKGGFKEFKVGDEFATHESKVKYMKTLDNADTKLYLVKDLISVKKYTGEVELEFYKNKVQEVIVSFKNTSKEDFEDLVKSLETLYGKNEKAKSKSKDTDRFEKLYQWTGQTIVLRIGYDENYKLTEMVYVANADLDKLKEEF